jgi:DNA (cytosine-5)-methyltransferase 1
MKKDGLNFIDLFAGAGGLSEGFIQAGFSPIAHVEMNAMAAATLETRSVYHYLKSRGTAIKIYYKYAEGQITREALFADIPDTVTKSVINKEMSATTISGIFDKIDNIMIENDINHVNLVIGGLPCQAYSLVGRA